MRTSADASVSNAVTSGEETTRSAEPRARSLAPAPADTSSAEADTRDLPTMLAPSWLPAASVTAPEGDEYLDSLRGRVISGKYRLLRPLNHGGMGYVWVAHNEMLDVQVAIKLLHDEMHSPEIGRRMVQEARLAARLEHPNIVRIHDLGFTDWNAPYIVMELLDGHDLRDELNCHEKMSPVAAVRMLLPILDSLNCAHDLGIVHRDLKPENIFLAKGQGLDCLVPKLVDFGIARSISHDSETRRITRRGSVFGTVQYISPEQALGEDDVDHRADLWAFCAVLYECIVGRPLFDTNDAALALVQVIDGIVEPPDTRGVDDEGLWPILANGLTRKRDDRWASARDLGQALAEWLALREVYEDVCGTSTRARWFGSLPDQDIPARSPSAPPVSLAIAARASSIIQDTAPAAFESAGPLNARRRSGAILAVAGSLGLAATVIGIGVALISVTTAAADAAVFERTPAGRQQNTALATGNARAGASDPERRPEIKPATSSPKPAPALSARSAPNGSTATTQPAPSARTRPGFDPVLGF